MTGPKQPKKLLTSQAVSHDGIEQPTNLNINWFECVQRKMHFSFFQVRELEMLFFLSEHYLISVTKWVSAYKL